jgi:hypothetical protein
MSSLFACWTAPDTGDARGLAVASLVCTALASAAGLYFYITEDSELALVNGLSNIVSKTFV